MSWIINHLALVFSEEKHGPLPSSTQPSATSGKLSDARLRGQVQPPFKKNRSNSEKLHTFVIICGIIGVSPFPNISGNEAFGMDVALELSPPVKKILPVGTSNALLQAPPGSETSNQKTMLVGWKTTNKPIRPPNQLFCTHHVSMLDGFSIMFNS